MIDNGKIQKILYGGDYNPEQWPEEVWEEDMRMLKLAHVDILTLNVQHFRESPWTMPGLIPTAC